jgi:hypothetical protein
MLREDPILLIPYALSDEPIRTKDRTAREEPNMMKSRADMHDPSLDIP